MRQDASCFSQAPALHRLQAAVIVPIVTCFVQHSASIASTCNMMHGLLRRWLIVSYHEPYYTTQGPGSLAVYFQQNLEDLFYQYGVDIVINGHVHSYERTFPVYKGAVRVLFSVHALCLRCMLSFPPPNAKCQALRIIIGSGTITTAFNTHIRPPLPILMEL